jgi:hypothetical protein
VDDSSRRPTPRALRATLTGRRAGSGAERDGVVWLLVRRKGKNPVAGRNVVIRSYNLQGENRCVDVFRRPDGSYGFEEYRREPEDGRGWFAIGDYSTRSFEREPDAVASAKASISWLA